MPDSTNPVSRPRVLSGMRPTGKLHLGNYMGALANWVRLQDTTKYECYFFIADWHALTTDYADPSQIRKNVTEVALDYLAAGLDPQRSVLFIQSHVPQHAELHLLLSMITSLGWLERVPTYKEQQENITGKDLTTYGFLGYPLLQSADILLYQPKFVPVGQDQVAHVELTREVARRFNKLYPRASYSEHPGIGLVEELHPFEILPEPEALLTPSPKLPGTDGRKMSKSYGNTIGLTDSASQVSEKLHNMTNGGQRIFISDPGDPEVCPVYDLHKLFSTSEVRTLTGIGCRTASLSCIECKELAAESINKRIGPIQNKRSEFEFSPKKVVDILEDGAQRAAARAEITMRQVRDAMGMSREIPFGRISTFENLSRDTDSPIAHVLGNHSGMWHWPSDQLEAFLIDFWKSNILPSEFNLRSADEGTFMTNRNKRVLIAAAREESDGWHFRIPAKSYEVWVLLCWENSFRLEDFVIPQKYFQQDFARARKASKGGVHLNVKKSGESRSLDIVNPHNREQAGRAIASQAIEPIPITELRSKYDFLN